MIKERTYETICYNCFNEDGPASVPDCEKCGGYGWIEVSFTPMQELMNTYLDNGSKKEDADMINSINGIWVIK